MVLTTETTETQRKIESARRARFLRRSSVLQSGA